MEFFRINSKLVKAPKNLSLSYEVLDKSERTMDGTMVVDIVGRKRKISVTWEYLSNEDMKILANETSAGSFVTITFKDGQTAESSTITAKPEDLTHEPYFNWSKGALMWKSVSASFIER